MEWVYKQLGGIIHELTYRFTCVINIVLTKYRDMRNFSGRNYVIQYKEMSDKWNIVENRKTIQINDYMFPWNSLKYNAHNIVEI